MGPLAAYCRMAVRYGTRCALNWASSTQSIPVRERMSIPQCMFTRVKCLETQATWDPPSESHGIPALDCIPHRSEHPGRGSQEVNGG